MEIDIAGWKNKRIHFEVYKNWGQVNDVSLRLFIVSARILGFSLAWPLKKNERLSSTLNFARDALCWLFFGRRRVLRCCRWCCCCCCCCRYHHRVPFLIYMYSCSSTFDCRLLHSKFNFSAIEWMRYPTRKKRQNYQATIPQEMRNNSIAIKNTVHFFSILSFQIDVVS